MLRGPRSTAHRSTPTNCTPDLSQTQVLKPSSGRIHHTSTANQTYKLSLAAGEVSAGLLAVKAKPLRGGIRPALTAPTPSGIGSYARNREKTGQQVNHRYSYRLALLKFNDILPGYLTGNE